MLSIAAGTEAQNKINQNKFAIRLEQSAGTRMLPHCSEHEGNRYDYNDDEEDDYDNENHHQHQQFQVSPAAAAAAKANKQQEEAQARLHQPHSLGRAHLRSAREARKMCARASKRKSNHLLGAKLTLPLAVFLGALALAVALLDASGALAATSPAVASTIGAKLAQTAMAAAKRNLRPLAAAADALAEARPESRKQSSSVAGSAGGQLGDWLVHSVAPVVATRLIDNIVSSSSTASQQQQQAAQHSATKSASSAARKLAKSLSEPIDTQALADKIVDRLADGIKRRKTEKQQQQQQQRSEATSGAPNVAMTAATAAATTTTTTTAGQAHETSATAGANQLQASSRRGKSLVSDSVQQVMQNLLPLAASGPAGQRGLFGRAMERHRQLTHTFGLQHFGSSAQQQPARSSNSWSLSAPKEHQQQHHHHQQHFEQPAVTDASQLDENPVVLRAEHGHNLTTISPPALQQNYVAVAQRQQQMRQKQQLANKYVHTNRHNQQQQLAPKPWQQQQQQQQQAHNKRHQQSPYSLVSVVSPTSDINVVQAPSSPAPPQLLVTTNPTTTSTSTSTTQLPPITTSTVQPPPPPAAYPQQQQQQQHHNHHQITQVGNNKFKINNRHQYPSSSVAIAPNSWFSSNQPHRFQHHNPYAQSHAASSRYPAAAGSHLHSQPSSFGAPSTTSTTTTTTSTTTTTTTTTTPEPPPQTDYAMTPDMMPLLDEQQSSASNSVSSILSSVAASALETLGSSQSVSSSSSSAFSSSLDNGDSYAAPSISGGGAGNFSSSLQQHGGAVKGQAAPSTTSARHSVITAEAIPTALGAPLYHLTRNMTTHSFIGPHQMSATPPRRSSWAAALAPGVSASPASKALAQYVQKGVNNLSSTIFSRQSKGWARRLGLSSVLLSGLLYGAAVLSNPGAPLPTNGAEVIKALGKGLANGKRRRTFGTNLGLGPAELAASQINDIISSTATGASASGENIDRNTAALLDNNVQLLYQQQPQLMAIIENLLQQEQQAYLQRQQQQQQQQQQQSSLFSQRSLQAGALADGAQQAPAQWAINAQAMPIEIEEVRQTDDKLDQAAQLRRRRSDQLQAHEPMPSITSRFVGAPAAAAPALQPLTTTTTTSQLNANNLYTLRAIPAMSTTRAFSNQAMHLKF